MFGDQVGTYIVLKVGKVAFDSKTKSEISFVSIGVFAVFYVKTNLFPKTSIFLREIDLPILKPNNLFISPPKQA
jgi:hypothetical protein